MSCGAKSDVAAHGGGTATCQGRAECTTCGTAYGALGAHRYDGQPWLSNGDGHWRVCSLCSTPATAAAHDFVNGNCTVCGRSEEYTITFDGNGGTSPADQTTVNGKLTSLPTSTQSGYAFLGWYTAANGGTAVTTDTVFTEHTPFTPTGPSKPAVEGAAALTGPPAPAPAAATAGPASGRKWAAHRKGTPSPST